MTASLKKVLTRINRLSTKEQNAIAEMLSNELNWEKSFKESPSELSQLASEAIAEYKSGKTRPLKLK
jgi:hypothetical protein